jgi:membrane protein implicated in regulation of membrane protease activity
MFSNVSHLLFRVEVPMEFAEEWLWLVFIVVGLLLAALELVFGLDTSFDLVITGSAFILGGFLAWLFGAWLVAPIATIVTGVAYIALGRRYIKQMMGVPKEPTNVDAIIGRSGVALSRVSRAFNGRVRVGNEEWRARSAEEIETGEEIVVKAISGVTLVVEKSRR